MQISAISGKIQTTVSVNCGYVGYDPRALLKSMGIIINATTKSFTDFATDGKHIWLRANNRTTVKYNGVTCDFVRDGNYFMITLPDNYDPTIPFVF